MGWPLPRLFPTVTMSGTTPKLRSKLNKQIISKLRTRKMLPKPRILPWPAPRLPEEAPHVLARPSQPSLHLIGDDKTSMCPHGSVHSGGKVTNILIYGLENEFMASLHFLQRRAVQNKLRRSADARHFPLLGLP